MNENSGKGTKVGTLTAIDEDRNNDGSKQQHTFSLVENPHGLFRINLMNQLEIAVDNKLCLEHGGKYCELNYEDNRFVTIKIRATDNGSPAKNIDARFIISLVDINEAPRSLKLSKSVMMENATIGSIVGRFTFDDEDIGQTQNISLLIDCLLYTSPSPRDS